MIYTPIIPNVISTCNPWILGGLKPNRLPTATVLDGGTEEVHDLEHIGMGDGCCSTGFDTNLRHFLLLFVHRFGDKIPLIWGKTTTYWVRVPRWI